MNVLFALDKRASTMYLHNFSVEYVPIDIHKFSHPKFLLKDVSSICSSSHACHCGQVTAIPWKWLEFQEQTKLNKLSTRDSCAIEKQNPTSHGFHNEDSPSCALCRLTNPAIIFSQHRKTDLNECWESLEATCRMSLWSHWGRCQHPRRDRCLQCAIGVILHAFKYYYLCM